MGTTLTEKETRDLLNRISSRDKYKQVMDFLDDSDDFYPFSIEEMKLIIEKGLKDAKSNLGKTAQEMRNKYPR